MATLTAVDFHQNLFAFELAFMQIIKQESLWLTLYSLRNSGCAPAGTALFQIGSPHNADIPH